MSNRDLVKAILYGVIKTMVLTLAILFIADDLGLLETFPRK